MAQWLVFSELVPMRAEFSGSKPGDSDNKIVKMVHEQSVSSVLLRTKHELSGRDLMTGEVHSQETLEYKSDNGKF